MATLAVTEAVKSISQAESMFGLSRTFNPRFFTEWQEQLPALTASEEATCDRIKASYLYNSAEGPLLESTVNLLLISPLLYLSGFCDPPFKIRGEVPTTISASEGTTTLRGRIDALVLQEQIWLALVESEQAKFSFPMAIPQTLAYLTSAPQRDQPLFGMVTNGDGFMFVKLDPQQSVYAFSDDFSLFKQSENQLYSVLKILKNLPLSSNILNNEVAN